jgi:DUF4097 and DUF4098 domain-containing protein YvlB
MIHTLSFLALAVGGSALGQQQARYATDTTIGVEAGTRLRIQNQGGDIAVRTWDRNQLRIQADHSRRTEVEISRRGSVVDLDARGRMGMQGLVDYEITAPAWMALELGGMNAEVRIEGTRAAIKVETLQGDIVVRGGAETVRLTTVNGSIDLSGATGRIELHATSGDIDVRDVQGDLTAESVSGDVSLRDVDARSVEAQSVSGDLVLVGTIADRGSYSLLTHSGDVTLGIAETANALLHLSSASGDFDLGFPLQAERTTRRRQTYRLGDGSATIDLETFSGDISVVRPGDVPAERGDRRPPGVRVRIPGLSLRIPEVRVRIPELHLPDHWRDHE